MRNNAQTRLPDHIAFITYETPFAPCGGVAAVIDRLPRYLQAASSLPTLVITPFHYRIPKTAAIESQAEPVGRIHVPYDGGRIPLTLLRLDRDGVWIFLKAEDSRFFAGARHPYDVGFDPQQITLHLRRDALLFGSAVAHALPLVQPQATWTLLAQDWEAATIALALAGESHKVDALVFLTLHNSYDTAASDEDLLAFSIDPYLCPGKTILRRALPLVQEPVFTVSDQFASDFSEEILQSQVLAPHLRGRLANKMLGVNNGLFAELAIEEEVLGRARRGDYTSLREWKLSHRQQAIRLFESITPDEERPLWGDLDQFDREDAPWFVLAGRDDSRQKGYDVACSAIRRFLHEQGRARFLFFPIPGDEGLPGLNFLKELAVCYPESVLALPFSFKEGYFTALQGAAYGLMPSLYEPFGMVNEFYLNGAIGIGRATGGIVQQIVPLRSAASFSHAVQRRADRWYSACSQPTGFLYRERDHLPTAIADWQAINDADYDPAGAGPNRLEQRERLPVFREMARELYLCLNDAVKVYREQPDLYYQMLVAGIDYLRSNFSWERASHAYARYLA